MKTSQLCMALGLASLLAACGSKKTAEETTAAATAPAAAAAATEPAPAATAPPAATASAAPATFDLNSVPISTASLGGFPYFSKLPGYRVNVPSDSVAFEFDRSYVYDGHSIVFVEGRVLRVAYVPVDSKKETSVLMQQRNYENLVKGLGGVQVSAGTLPYEVVDKFGREEYNKHNGGMEVGKEVETYVIRQKDKQIWLQVMPDEYGPHLAVTETAAMPQRATTLPAAELKKN
ncbi:MAG: hypothetical protein ACRYFK_16545 [Janthinobacterium lividum]